MRGDEAVGVADFVVSEELGGLVREVRLVAGVDCAASASGAGLYEDERRVVSGYGEEYGLRLGIGLAADYYRRQAGIVRGCDEFVGDAVEVAFAEVEAGEIYRIVVS